MENLITVQNTAAVPQIVKPDYMQRFIDYLDASESTIRTYTTALKQFARWMAENGIVSPVREDILAYKTWLKETPYEKNGKLCQRKPNTIQSYITVVRIFFEWLQHEGLYPNIADHIKGAKVSRSHKKEAFTGKQARMILDAMPKDSLKDLRDYAIMITLFTGGLRTIEVHRARIGDLKTMGGHSVLMIQGKGQEEATDFINLIPETEEAIRKYLAARGPVEKNELLFISLSNNSRGKAISTRSISGLAKASFRAAGFDDEMWTAHSTRHTAITLALLEGEDIQEVQAFARHSNINTTLIYAHNIQRAKSGCEASAGKAIFG